MEQFSFSTFIVCKSSPTLWPYYTKRGKNWQVLLTEEKLKIKYPANRIFIIEYAFNQTEMYITVNLLMRLQRPKEIPFFLYGQADTVHYIHTHS